jgi:hypothetical protein
MKIFLSRFVGSVIWVFCIFQLHAASTGQEIRVGKTMEATFASDPVIFSIAVLLYVGGAIYPLFLAAGFVLCLAVFLIGATNKAMKPAIEKHGLGRANSTRPLWRRYA